MSKIPIKLSDATGVPYYRQIYDQIAEYIRSGQLPPNSQLPSVRELAQELLVSLITVRRTYADLETSGFIVRRQGQGTYVAEEVETASRKQALKAAYEALSQAVTQAKRLGLEHEEIKGFLTELMEREEAGDARA